MTVLDDRLSEFSDRVQDKAAVYVAKKPDQIVRDQDHESVFWIRGEYRVQVAADGHCMCTCPHGMNNSPAYCYHAAAALLTLQKLGEDQGWIHDEPETDEEEDPEFDFDDADEILDLSDEETKD